MEGQPFPSEVEVPRFFRGVPLRSDARFDAEVAAELEALARAPLELAAGGAAQLVDRAP